MTSFKSKLLFLCLLFTAFFLAAPVKAMTPPEVVVKQTVEGALKELEQRREELKLDKAELYVAIERHLAPAIHFDRISKLVLGKNWRKATDSQRIDFTHHFKKSLLNTYATAIFDYSGQKIVYMEAKESGKAKVKVPTQFITDSGEIIPVIYSMSNKDDNKWRAYDIKIVLDGASTSLVQLYRSQFNSVIARKGIDGLINDLKSKHDSDMTK